MLTCWLKSFEATMLLFTMFGYYDLDFDGLMIEAVGDPLPAILLILYEFWGIPPEL